MNIYWLKIKELIESLDTETAEIVHGLSREKVFKKSEYLLKEGHICKGSYLIIEGIARKFYLNDGKEITTEFYFTHDIAVSLRSYCLNQPSTEYIQALTNLRVVHTDHDDFEKAKMIKPSLHEFDLKLNEFYAMWLEERLYQFHVLSAKERYLQLLETSPNIIQFVPLTYIASYLGISLETLSRIRARLD